MHNSEIKEEYLALINTREKKNVGIAGPARPTDFWIEVKWVWKPTHRASSR